MNELDPQVSAELDAIDAALAGDPIGPGSPGRKLVQSAQLSLTTQPDRVDQVAGEVFEVVRAENGILDSSAVTQTGGSDGNAQVALRVPGASLGDTMAKLSELAYAR